MWAAYTGTTSLRGSDGSAVKMDISQIIPHPSYNADTADYDVAVLELKRPVTFTKYIQPVCLPDAGHHFPTSKKCLISGWGYLKEDFCKQSMASSRGDMVGCEWGRRHWGREFGPCPGQLQVDCTLSCSSCAGLPALSSQLCLSYSVVKPEFLQKATVELLDQNLCSSLYSHALTDRMMCAGYLEGKVDSCQVSFAQRRQHTCLHKAFPSQYAPSDTSRSRTDTMVTVPIEV